jgi:O-antigen/teichoic acid export membrane protein
MFSRLIRHSIWLLFGRLGTQAGAALFTIILARRLGSAGFGEFAFITAIIFVTNALTTFGTDMLLIREIAAQDDLSRLPAALLLQLILSVTVIVAVWLFGGRIPNQSAETILALRVYVFSLIPLAFFTVFTTALRGKQHMGAYLIINMASAIMQVGAVLYPKINIVSLFALIFIVQTVVAVLAGILCAILIPGFWKAWRHAALLTISFLKDVAPLALLTIMTILYQRLSVLTLSLMTSSEQVGLFSAAARIVEASKTIHLGIFTALYPAMSQAQPDALNRSIWDKTFKWSWRILFAGAVLIALTLCLTSTILVRAFYGDQFIVSATILQILAWALIPFTINTYLTLSYLASNQEGLVGRAFAASLLSLLILNLWWIPRYGPAGSAWASLIAECIQSIILLVGKKSILQIKEAEHEFS